MRKTIAVVLILVAVALAQTGWARRVEPVMEAVAERVLDGDTIKVRLVGEMPELFREESVRLRHCDTPEKHDPRPDVAELARRATAFTSTRITPGLSLTLRAVGFDKYGGRLLADVEVGGENLCQALLDAGLAHPYEGGKKDW
jgi:micrococcal nuclease